MSMIEKIKKGIQELLLCAAVGFIIGSPLFLHHWMEERSMEQLFASTPKTVITVTVQPGDSIWGLSAQYAPNDYPLESYVKHVRLYNRLDNSVLQPGQVLSIPVY